MRVMVVRTEETEYAIDLASITSEFNLGVLELVEYRDALPGEIVISMKGGVCCDSKRKNQSVSC